MSLDSDDTELNLYDVFENNSANVACSVIEEYIIERVIPLIEKSDDPGAKKDLTFLFEIVNSLSRLAPVIDLLKTVKAHRKNVV